MLEFFAQAEPCLVGMEACGKILAGQIEDLDKSLNDLEGEIAAAHAGSAISRLLVEIPGIGKLIASAIAESRAGSGRVQIQSRFFRLARPHAEAKLKRRQANARSHHQAGQPIHPETAGLRDDFAPQGRGQAQGRLARLDRPRF
jgi:transposase